MPQTSGVLGLLLTIHIYTITTIVVSIAIVYIITKKVFKSHRFPGFLNKTK
jgi:hypothetical protein